MTTDEDIIMKKVCTCMCIPELSVLKLMNIKRRKCMCSGGPQLTVRLGLRVEGSWKNDEGGRFIRVGI